MKTTSYGPIEVYRFQRSDRKFDVIKDVILHNSALIQIVVTTSIDKQKSDQDILTVKRTARDPQYFANEGHMRSGYRYMVGQLIEDGYEQVPVPNPQEMDAPFAMHETIPCVSEDDPRESDPLYMDLGDDDD